MTRFRNIALAALALIGIFAAGNAQAQVQGSKALPAPVQRQWIADERIYMEVFVDNAQRPGNNPEQPGRVSSYPYGEHYGNRLGDVVPMRIRIFCIRPSAEAGAVAPKPSATATGNTTLPVVLLDFAALKNGRLTIDEDPDKDPDWVFAKKESLGPNESPLELPTEARIVTIETPDGQKRDAELWDIRMFVQTRRRPEPMLFWMEFNYCTELNANGQKEWKRADTPDFIVSGSYTGDKGRDLEIGNTNIVDQQSPSGLALLLASLGGVMLLLPLGLIAVKAVQRAMAKPTSNAPSPAQFWAELDPVLAQAKTNEGYCFEPDDVMTVVTTFKKYIGFNGTAAQFKKMIGEFDHGELIYKLLDNLQYRVLEQEQISPQRAAAGHTTAGLSDKRYAELVALIEKLIPRP